jgi:glycosyltransferase involved in cell wall biosynthesis
VRILVASGSWYPEMNGLARVATETARLLATRGHEITALVPRLSGVPQDADSDGPLSVCRVLKRGLLPLTIGDVLEVQRHAHRLHQSFDVLMAHGATAAVGLAWSGLSAPLVPVFHASYRRELRFTRPRLRWGRDRLVAYLNEPISAIQEREMARRAATIVVLSEFSRSLLVADHAKHLDKVRVVSGGVYCDSFFPADGMRAARARLGLDQSRRLLVTVRRAEPRMGIEELLRAVSLLEAPGIDLAIAGGGPLEPELRQLARALGIDGRVRFLGKVAESHLRDLYRAADLFVLPTVAYEGFGMVTVEALASGTPVVGTPVGATPELLTPLDARLVAPGSDAPSLAAAIREALNFVDDDFRAKCRDYAASRFDWADAIVGWESALEDAALQRLGALTSTSR